MPIGSEDVVFEGSEFGDFRKDLTTSLTPRLSVRCAAAVGYVSRLVRTEHETGPDLS
jgi:hypothetical protein